MLEATGPWHMCPRFNYNRVGHKNTPLYNDAFPGNCGIIEQTQITKFMGPTWGPPGSCRPQMGPMLAPGTLLSGEPSVRAPAQCKVSPGVGISIIKIRWSWNHLVFVMAIPILVRWYLYIETAHDVENAHVLYCRNADCLEIRFSYHSIPHLPPRCWLYVIHIL